jgi:hypothetical protein
MDKERKEREGERKSEKLRRAEEEIANVRVRMAIRRLVGW